MEVAPREIRLELSASLEATFRRLAADRRITTSAVAGTVSLRCDGRDRAAACALRAAVAMSLAQGLPSEEARELRAINERLEPAVASHRKLRATFPSRRRLAQLTETGIDPTAVAGLIGMNLKAGTERAADLDLRLSTADQLMHRASRQIDVVVDAGLITDVLGQHID